MEHWAQSTNRLCSPRCISERDLRALPFKKAPAPYFRAREVPEGRPEMESPIDGRSARAERTFQSCDTYQPRGSQCFRWGSTLRNGSRTKKRSFSAHTLRSRTMLSMIHEKHSDIYLDRLGDATRSCTVKRPVIYAGISFRPASRGRNPTSKIEAYNCDDRATISPIVDRDCINHMAVFWIIIFDSLCVVTNACYPKPYTDRDKWLDILSPLSSWRICSTRYYELNRLKNDNVASTKYCIGLQK